jgi:hypothetical protein
MYELASRLTLARITNVTIEKMHKCLTVGGEEEGHCGCDVGVVHRGIFHSKACPPAGGAHDGGQYPWSKGRGGVLELWPGWSAGGGCGQYPAGGGGSSHIEVYPIAGDPPHGIPGVGPI